MKYGWLNENNKAMKEEDGQMMEKAEEKGFRNTRQEQESQERE